MLKTKQIAVVDRKLLKIEIALIETEWHLVSRERKIELHNLWKELEIMEATND